MSVTRSHQKREGACSQQPLLQPLGSAAPGRSTGLLCAPTGGCRGLLCAPMGLRAAAKLASVLGAHFHFIKSKGPGLQESQEEGQVPASASGR